MVAQPACGAGVPPHRRRVRGPHRLHPQDRGRGLPLRHLQDRAPARAAAAGGHGRAPQGLLRRQCGRCRRRRRRGPGTHLPDPTPAGWLFHQESPPREPPRLGERRALHAGGLPLQGARHRAPEARGAAQACDAAPAGGALLGRLRREAVQRRVRQRHAGLRLRGTGGRRRRWRQCGPGGEGRRGDGVEYAAGPPRPRFAAWGNGPGCGRRDDADAVRGDAVQLVRVARGGPRAAQPQLPPLRQAQDLVRRAPRRHARLRGRRPRAWLCRRPQRHQCVCPSLFCPFTLCFLHR